MPRRNPIRWLMTDERLGDLATVLRRLPPGTGVVFRHYRTPPSARRALLRQAARIAAARRLVLVASRAGGGAAIAGVHAAGGSGYGGRPLMRSSPAHDRRQAIVARRAGATILFVSPVFATRSHPGVHPLRRWQAAGIARGLGATVIALGGMTARRWRRIRAAGFAGWAAIDAWAPTHRQKRNAVPR